MFIWNLNNFCPITQFCVYNIIGLTDREFLYPSLHQVIGSVTSLRPFSQSVGRFVCPLVCHKFLNGWEVTLPCSIGALIRISIQTFWNVFSVSEEEGRMNIRLEKWASEHERNKIQRSKELWEELKSYGTPVSPKLLFII